MRRHGWTEPAILVALTLSVLVHIAALWRWPLQPRFPSETSEPREGGVLVVQLAPVPAPRRPHRWDPRRRRSARLRPRHARPGRRRVRSPSRPSSR